MRQKGFTVVELLVVISIIGILAALSYNFFIKSPEEARVTRAKAEMKTLVNLIATATSTENKLLLELTGTSWTDEYCWYDSNYTWTPMRDVPKTSPCWTSYWQALDRIAQASGESSTIIEQLKKGDPWGSPYLIDENAGDVWDPFSPNACRRDTVSSAGKSGIAYGPTQIAYDVPHTIRSECIE